MPLYEYKCPNCGNEFEKIHKSTDRDKPAPCPKCKTEAKKLVSKTSFQLNGGGWAADGYGK